MSKEISPELSFAKFQLAQKIKINGRNFPKYFSREGNIYSLTLLPKGGVFYQYQTTDDMEHSALVFLSSASPEKASARTASSCVATAAMLLPCIPASMESDNVLIGCQNGTLVVNHNGGLSFRQSNPSDGLTFVLDCDFDDTAECPTFNRFLSEVLPTDAVEFLQEYVGYTLLPDCRFQTALFQLGAGANGKSVVAEICAALHANVCSVALDRLEGFQLVGLVAASLALVDETPAKIDQQRIKMLISGGLVQIDRKYRDPISLHPTAKFIINGNQLPNLSDHSHGFWRRFAILEYSRSFSVNEQNPLLARQIISNELSGVLNWAALGLCRLLGRGNFLMPESSIRAKADAQIESNSVAAWIDQRNVRAGNFEPIAKDSVYQSYRDWCSDNGMQPVASIKFWKRIVQQIPKVKYTKPRIFGQQRPHCDLCLG